MVHSIHIYIAPHVDPVPIVGPRTCFYIPILIPARVVASLLTQLVWELWNRQCLGYPWAYMVPWDITPMYLHSPHVDQVPNVTPITCSYTPILIPCIVVAPLIIPFVQDLPKTQLGGLMAHHGSTSAYSRCVTSPCIDPIPDVRHCTSSYIQWPLSWRLMFELGTPLVLKMTQMQQSVTPW